MQQSSATQSLHLSFWGLRKIVACSHSSSQCLLVSTVFSTVSSLHPTSFLMIFILVVISALSQIHGNFVSHPDPSPCWILIKGRGLGMRLVYQLDSCGGCMCTHSDNYAFTSSHFG